MLRLHLFSFILFLALVTPMANAKPLEPSLTGNNNSTETSDELPNIEILTLKGLPLRILTFNVWLTGVKVENGLYKIAKHIKLLQPDIVALQEVQSTEIFQELLSKLGHQWTGVVSPHEYSDNAILTTHIIDNTSIAVTENNRGLGATIRLRGSNKDISFWCLHFTADAYGPYAANNKQVTKIEQILAGEAPKPHKDGNLYPDSRQDNCLGILKDPNFQKSVEQSSKIPMIAAGDLNSPSHLDWIEETKDIHGGWVVSWPSTHLLQSKTGLIDSFRHLYPDPVKTPGLTWSTVNLAVGPEWDWTIPEPLDRIDYIFYKSPKLTPIESFLYSGTEPLKPIPNHAQNDYPSDHFAVVTDFVLDF